MAFPNQFLNYRFISRNASNSFILKIIFVTIIFSAARLRYCFAWLMVDFRALLLDSDIRHKRRRYSRGQNIGIAKVEFANCQSEAMSYWNISIARWLRDDVYLRALVLCAKSPVVTASELDYRTSTTLDRKSRITQCLACRCIISEGTYYRHSQIQMMNPKSWTIMFVRERQGITQNY